VKAALFTAIVTSFALDALSNFTEDTSTQLLRILAEQATAGQAVDIPQPGPSSSNVIVTSLWLLSIMSSLAATTWAILSLEWFAFLSEGIKAEDYEEMAVKRQQRLEAIKRWKMHIIVASIPFLLHLSLFLFLAGLWLRLRDVNRQLELIVGIPSLLIAVSYAIVILLPMFTEAPFFTSLSELISPLVNEFRYLLSLRHFVRAPPIFTWISRSLASIPRKPPPHPDPVHRKRLRSPLRVVVNPLIRSLKYICKFIGPPFYVTWVVVTRVLHAILPRFRPGGDLFKELNRLQFGSSGRDEGIHRRALLWLMNTPLTQSEVMEILKEFSRLRNLKNPEEPLDRAIVKLLVFSLSSVLENGRITKDERPIFDHCTMLLTEEMDRTFRDAGYNPRILVRNTTISNGLKGYVNFDTSVPSPHTDAYEDYWNKVVRLLWLSPSKEQIQDIIKRLEPNVRSMEPSSLLRVVRGLHAATLTALEAGERQHILDFPLPDFSQWRFSDDGPISDDERTADAGLAGDDWSTTGRPHLDRELSAFFQNLFAEFHKAAQPVGQKQKSPTTVPSLVVACIKLLDSHPQGEVPLEFHTALCFFVTTMWRNDPDMFDTDPSVAQALVASIKDFLANSTGDTPNRSKKIATRLRMMANGPKHVASLPHTRSETIVSLYPGLVKDYPECLPEFIHVTAAALEAVLAREIHPGALELGHHRVVQNIISPSFFTDHLAFDFSSSHPDYRLPYLYSLAIAHSREILGTGQNPPEVLLLLRTSGEKRGSADVERVLDTNILAINVLKHTLPHQVPRRVVAEADLRTYLDPITQALRPLQGIIENRGVYPWRTRWKAIYLLADIRSVLPQALTDFGQLESLINDTSNAVRAYIAEPPQDGPAPCDWKMKKDGLCELKEVVKGFAKRNEGTKGVYSWSRSEWGDIPYLSLYPQCIRYELTSRAGPYRFLDKLQR
jgi:hypothetical protein